MKCQYLGRGLKAPFPETGRQCLPMHTCASLKRATQARKVHRCRFRRKAHVTEGMRRGGYKGGVRGGNGGLEWIGLDWSFALFRRAIPGSHATGKLGS